MDHRIAEGRKYWDRHAQSDPMWAVLSDPAKRGRKWNLQEFMANGEREIALLWHELAQLHLDPTHGTALDFGCGIGRLTQALARRFDRVIGVDISPSMIAVASDLNRYPSKAEYLSNAHPDLRELVSGSFDFIYSNIVLQHVEPRLTVAYLNEFFRLLKPGGVLVFQLPSHHESQAETKIRPMPNAAYQARIELTNSIPTELEPLELQVTVRVTNASAQEWRQRDSGSIRLGNHWFDKTGQFVVIQDDGRAVLPQTVRPGESCDIVLAVVPPTTPGHYQGEIDVVHEGVTWFRDKGSQTVRFNVEVTAHDSKETARSAVSINEFPVPDYPGERLQRLGEPGDNQDAVSFPMHGVPRTEVTELVKRHGGTIIHVEEGHRAGVEWVDYRYFVRAGGIPT